MRDCAMGFAAIKAFTQANCGEIAMLGWKPHGYSALGHVLLRGKLEAACGNAIYIDFCHPAMVKIAAGVSENLTDRQQLKSNSLK
jgi:hypothetical protein